MSSSEMSRTAGAAGPSDPRWPHLHPLARGLERAVHLLDSALPIPGTKIRIGLDPVMGLVAPGAGDALGGAVSLSLLFLALQYRLPLWAIAKMVMNIAVDAAVGGIPLVGDFFDVVWKSNEKNLQLLQDHRDPQRRRMPLRYWISVSLLLVIGAACLLAPIVLVIWLAAHLVGKAS